MNLSKEEKVFCCKVILLSAIFFSSFILGGLYFAGIASHMDTWEAIKIITPLFVLGALCVFVFCRKTERKNVSPD